jgi:hypothetical protein
MKATVGKKLSTALFFVVNKKTTIFVMLLILRGVPQASSH